MYYMYSEKQSLFLIFKYESLKIHTITYVYYQQQVHSMQVLGRYIYLGNHNKYTCKIKMHNFLLRGRTRHIISIYVFIQQVYIFFHTFSFDHCLYIEEIYEPFKPIGPFDQIKSKAPICSVYSLDRQRVRTMHAQRKLQYKVYCFRIRRKFAMFLQHISQIQIFFCIIAS